MFAGQFVSSKILPIQQSTSIGEVQSIFLDTEQKLLPLLDADIVVGWISAQQVLQSIELDAPVGTLALPREPKMEVKIDTHFFELVRIFSESNAKQLLVIDANDAYTGLILADGMGMQWHEQTYLKSPGAILVLEMDWIQYSLAEIARIAESNEVKILQVVLQKKSEGSAKLKIALKFDRYEIGGLLAAFERYGYQITYKFTGDDDTGSFEERYKWLMKIIEA